MNRMHLCTNKKFRREQNKNKMQSSTEIIVKSIFKFPLTRKLKVEEKNPYH